MESLSFTAFWRKKMQILQQVLSQPKPHRIHPKVGSWLHPLITIPFPIQTYDNEKRFGYCKRKRWLRQGEVCCFQNIWLFEANLVSLNITKIHQGLNRIIEVPLSVWHSCRFEIVNNVAVCSSRWRC